MIKLTVGNPSIIHVCVFPPGDSRSPLLLRRYPLLLTRSPLLLRRSPLLLRRSPLLLTRSPLLLRRSPPGYRLRHLLYLAVPFIFITSDTHLLPLDFGIILGLYNKQALVIYGTHTHGTFDR